jgi:hypothetical protein
MATTYHIVDDLDGVTPNAQPIQFGLNGDTWTIDLAEPNLDKLREALAPFISVAQKAPKAARPSGVRPQQKAPGVSPQVRAALETGKLPEPPSIDPKVIRAWAIDKGMEVPQRGRIPQAITQAYLEAVK